MSTMHHQVYIEASPQEVYNSITTKLGFTNWWTDDVECSDTIKVGEKVKFYFYNRDMCFVMNVDKLVPNKKVVLKCTGEIDDWTDTVLTFDLRHDSESNMTILSLTHDNWKEIDDGFALCNTSWGALMIYIKSYTEGHEPGPFFTDVQEIETFDSIA